MRSLPPLRSLLLLLFASSLLSQSYDDLVRAASASRASGDAKNAIEVANRAIAADGSRCEAFVVRALAEVQIGDYDAARESAETAIRLAPEDRRKGLQTLLDIDREQRVDKSVAEAKAAVEQKKWARAADAYAAAFEANPERGDLGLQAAALFARIEEHGHALAIVQKLVGSKDAKVKEGASELLNTLGAIVQPRFDAKVAEAKKAREDGDLDAARRLFEEALAILADQPEGEFELVCLLAQAGKTAEAGALLERAIGHGFTRASALAENPAVAKLASDTRIAELIRDTFGGGALKRMKDQAANASAAGKRGDRIQTSIGLAMIYIEPQSFAMGSPNSESGRADDETQHTVRITKGYWIGETEVTQKQWMAVMGTTPWQGVEYAGSGDNVAASCMDWNAAIEFCRKLTALEQRAGRLPAGHRYQLPTEAEWELACRAGSKTAYSFGDDASRLGQFAVFDGARADEVVHLVKSKAANAWGLYDMHGNVWEWCADEADYNGDVITNTYRDGISDPYNKGGSGRVGRGGCWNYSARLCRSAFRSANEPGDRDYGLGFRPALSARADK